VDDQATQTEAKLLSRQFMAHAQLVDCIAAGQVGDISLNPEKFDCVKKATQEKTPRRRKNERSNRIMYKNDDTTIRLDELYNQNDRNRWLLLSSGLTS
jgi:hypothetical protein